MTDFYRRKDELWNLISAFTERREREILADDAEYSDALCFQRKYTDLEFRWTENLLPPEMDRKFSARMHSLLFDLAEAEEHISRAEMKAHNIAWEEAERLPEYSEWRGAEARCDALSDRLPKERDYGNGHMTFLNDMGDVIGEKL